MVREAKGWDLLDGLQHSWLPDADSGGLHHRLRQEAPVLRTWGNGSSGAGGQQSRLTAQSTLLRALRGE